MPTNLEKRVAALEMQLAQMRRQQNGKPAGREWLHDLYGKFEGDPVFAKAMKLGEKYRQSLRPARRKTKP